MPMNAENVTDRYLMELETLAKIIPMSKLTELIGTPDPWPDNAHR